jgi:hypothetical protein
MTTAIMIRLHPAGEVEVIEIVADTEKGQNDLEPTARRIRRFLDWLPFRDLLARLLLSWAATILTRMKFTPWARK